jgi:hypothetical protein
MASIKVFWKIGLLLRYFTVSTIKHFIKETFISLPFPLPSFFKVGVIVSFVDEKIISIKKLESEIDMQLIKAKKTNSRF